MLERSGVKREKRVLVIEDDEDTRANLLEMLESEGMRAIGADCGRAGVELMRAHRFSLVICDVRMPEMNGFDVLREIRAGAATRSVPFVFLTGATEREDIRGGMSMGADDYITKPFTRSEIMGTIRARLGRTEQIQAEVTRSADKQIVVEDPIMAKVYHDIGRAAASTLGVLLLGETGVGKEVIARHVHEQSARAGKPFVAINCAAISDGLIESELFGHERGAYTGASSSRVGLLEMAAGGTVFLDEVGELPHSMQVKLLRVLEDRRVYRVGGRTSVALDVRFVAATNRDLEAAVAAGTFRADLLYRLNGFTVTIPPLRERPGDVIPLALEFVRAASERAERATPVLSARVVEALVSHPYPGNVRELKNAMDRAVAMCDGPRIELDHLPSAVGRPVVVVADECARDARAASAPRGPSGLRGEMEALEKKRIIEALERCGGNQTAAATVLGISRRTLVSRLSTFALPRPRKPSSTTAPAHRTGTDG